MPDVPDYSRYLGTSFRFSLQDLGELAVRLGSLHSYDRRGEIIWQDSFDYGLSAWTTNLSGTGSEVILAISPIYRRPYTVKLTTGSTVNRFAEMQTALGVQDVGKVGFEVVFASQTAFGYWEFFISIIQDDIERDIRVKVNYSDSSLSIWDENGVYQVVGTFDGMVTSPVIFVPIKIVLDVNTGKYVRLLFFDQSIDISAYSYAQSALVEPSTISLTIRLTADGAFNRIGYVAQYLLTANEP